MENLKTETMVISREGFNQEYIIKERDHGDLIVYDLFLKDDYLMTVNKEGDILFMNFETSPEDQELFRLNFLNKVIGRIVANG